MVNCFEANCLVSYRLLRFYFDCFLQSLILDSQRSERASKSHGVVVVTLLKRFVSLIEYIEKISTLKREQGKQLPGYINIVCISKLAIALNKK